MSSESRQPMDEVQARTTPGTDPRVEELRREQEGERMPHAQEGERMSREQEGERMAREQDRMGESREAYQEQREGEYRDDRAADGRGTNMERTGQPGVMSSELAGYHDRMSEVQARFIDDPRGALQEAGHLVKDAIDRVMEQAGRSETTDTEQMRVTMQRYRRLLETITESGR